MIARTLIGLFLVACGDDRGTGAVQIAPTQGSEAPPANELAVGGAGNDFIATRIRDRHREVGEALQPVTPVQSGSLQTSETARLEIPVEGGHCYVAIAAGVPSVRILDLRALDAYGNEVDADETEDAFPSVRFCAAVGGTTWAVEVRMYDGYGRYGLQIFGGEETT
jgi:hypothetical protein